MKLQFYFSPHHDLEAEVHGGSYNIYGEVIPNDKDGYDCGFGVGYFNSEKQITIGVFPDLDQALDAANNHYYSNKESHEVQ